MEYGNDGQFNDPLCILIIGYVDEVGGQRIQIFRNFLVNLLVNGVSGKGEVNLVIQVEVVSCISSYNLPAAQNVAWNIKMTPSSWILKIKQK